MIAVTRNKHKQSIISCHRKITNLTKQHALVKERNTQLKTTIQQQKVKNDHLTSDRVEKLNRKRLDVMQERRMVKKKFERVNILSKKCLEENKKLKHEIECLKNQLQEDKEVLFIGKVSNGKGHKEFPPWICQLAMELLVKKTPPSAVPECIELCARMMNRNVEIESLPTVRWVQKLRTAICVLTETLTAFRLANAQSWKQGHTDTTTHRQVPVINFLASICEDSVLCTLIVAASIVLVGETAAKQIETIEEVIIRGAQLLGLWKGETEKMFLNFDCNEHFPSPEQMSLGKLGNGGTVSGDNCNATNAVKDGLEEKVVADAKAHFLDKFDGIGINRCNCWQHLRCMWLTGTGKDSSCFLKEKLQKDLEKIDAIFRVNPEMESILRAVDKEFSLNANCPKGHGEPFRQFMEEEHQGELLF